MCGLVIEDNWVNSVFTLAWLDSHRCVLSTCVLPAHLVVLVIFGKQWVPYIVHAKTESRVIKQLLDKIITNQSLSNRWAIHTHVYIHSLLYSQFYSLYSLMYRSSLVPRPHLREGVWGHPTDTSGFIILSGEKFLSANHIAERQSVVQHWKSLATSARWHSTFFGV